MYTIKTISKYCIAGSYYEEEKEEVYSNLFDALYDFINFHSNYFCKIGNLINNETGQTLASFSPDADKICATKDIRKYIRKNYFRMIKRIIKES